MQHQVANEDGSYSPRLRRYKNHCKDFMVVESLMENQIQKFTDSMKAIHGENYKAK